MLYSSCKNSVVDVLEKVYSLPIDKKIEVDSGSELTEDFLMVRLSKFFVSEIFSYSFYPSKVPLTGKFKLEIFFFFLSKYLIIL